MDTGTRVRRASKSAAMPGCGRLGRFRGLHFSHLVCFLIPIMLWRCTNFYTSTQCLDSQLGARSPHVGGPPQPPDPVNSHYGRKFQSKPETPRRHDSPPTARVRTNVTINADLEKLYMAALERKRKTNIVEIRARRNATCHSQLPPEKPCVDTKCPSEFPLKRNKETLRTFLSAQVPVPSEALLQIKQITKKDKHRKLVIVTAASSNHFMEIQGLLKNLNEVLYPVLRAAHVDFELIFYDLNLTSREKEIMEKYCKCKVKKLPDEKFPRHVRNMYCFAWKPIIIAAHLPHSDMLLWVDSSARFLTGNISLMFQEVRQSHVLLSRSVYNLAQSVHKDTLSYYGDEACTYSSLWEFEANLILLQNDRFTRDLVVGPWLSCAFDSSCMCPPDSVAMARCDRKVRQYSKCHRFDQASLNLILLKLMGDRMPLVTIPKTIFHTVKRGDTAAYFQEQP